MHRLLALLLVGVLGAVAAADPPRVLVLMSYHQGMTWEDGIATGLRQSLGAQAELVYVYGDVKRFPDRSRIPGLLQMTRDLVAAARPALVLAVDDFAWDLALAHRDDVFPGLPVVFAGVNHWDGLTRPARTTGVVEVTDPAGTLALAFRFHPGARRVVVVNDRTETGLANRVMLDEVLPRVIGDRRVAWLGDGTFAETEAALAGLDPVSDVVLLMSWNLDAAGAVRSYEEAGARVRAVCPAPIYHLWDFYLGLGLVGGRILDAPMHGKRAGEIAARVLAGEDPEAIPVDTRSTTRLVLDQNELDRFGVAPDLVPSEAALAHRHPAFWRDNATGLVVVGGVIALQGLTIAGLLVAMRRRHRAEALAREGEARLHRMAVNSRDVVYRLDLTSGRYTFLSNAFETITGWTIAEASAQPWFARRLVPPERLPWLEEQFALIRRGEVADRYEYPILHRDGSQRWLEQRDTLVRDASGAPVALEGVARDVTAARDAEARLHQSQRMDAVGQLAAGVAHDFNNVLTAVLGHADLLMLQLGDRPERAHAEIIVGAAQRAAGTVRNLLSFARGHRDQTGSSDLDRLVRDAVALLTHSIDRRITITCILDQAGRVRLGGDELQQVLLNLGLNARDAMPEGGRLAFTTGRVTLSADAAGALGLEAGAYGLLEVRDSGCGIPPENQARIFEPFFTTKAFGKGSGLGLSVVHGAVCGAGGAIRVESQLGVGTSFRIWLPVVQDSVDHVSPRPISGDGLRVLLIDDEKVVLTVVGSLLEHCGCDVVCFDDAEKACAWFAEHHSEVDAALLDGNMPRMSGWQAAARLIAARPDLAIVGLTGAATSDALANWRSAGVVRVLSKPVTSEVLATVLAELMPKSGLRRPAGSRSPPPPSSA